MDGLACNDPATQTYSGWSKECSGIEVPDKMLEFYDIIPSCAQDPETLKSGLNHDDKGVCSVT